MSLARDIKDNPIRGKLFTLVNETLVPHPLRFIRELTRRFSFLFFPIED
jgi:hypothetical protein